MKQPNSIDPVEWARYNEWLSGAAIAAIPAAETESEKEMSNEESEAFGSSYFDVCMRSAG